MKNMRTYLLPNSRPFKRKAPRSIPSILMLIILLTFRVAAGQFQVADFEARLADGVGRNSDAVRLSLSTEGERSVFRIGERIPLVLIWESLGEKSVNVVGVTGRCIEDTFVFETDGLVDPTARYRAVGTGQGCGTTTGCSFGARPRKIEQKVELNEWARFRQSGRYRFFLESSRAILQPSGSKQTSNIVEIKIIDPPPGFATHEIDRARNLLKSNKPAERFSPVVES